MAETSGITWTDATYNPWIGCTKVGPGCDHCYAEADFDLRKGRVKWGAGNPRSRTKTGAHPHAWNRAHDAFFSEHGRNRRVFSASLADIFDNEVPSVWRADFWNTVAETRCLEWYIVTKRISNVEKMLPTPWAQDLFGHIVLLVTVVNQEEVDRDVPRLLALKAKYPWMRVGLSIEPMLGQIHFGSIKFDNGERIVSALDGLYGVRVGSGYEASGLGTGIDWIICGGESGLQARPIHPGWVRSLRDQCRAAHVPFHFKQWGEWAPLPERSEDEIASRTVQMQNRGLPIPSLPEEWCIRIGKARAGRVLDGIEHNGFPAEPAA